MDEAQQIIRCFFSVLRRPLSLILLIGGCALVILIFMECLR